MSPRTRATIEDLYRVPESGKAELVNGEIVHLAPTGGIPGRAGGEIYVSLRDVCRLKDILAWLASEDPDFDATLEVIEERPPTETPKDEPLVNAMAKAYNHLTGEEPTYNGVPGATDGTLLHAWAGIPIITTGAGK